MAAMPLTPTLVLILVGLLLLAWLLWQAFQAMRALRADPATAGGGEVFELLADARHSLDEEQQELERSLSELESQHALGRLEAADRAEVAGRLGAQLDGLRLRQQTGEELLRRRQRVEQELARRLGRAGVQPGPRTGPGRPGPSLAGKPRTTPPAPAGPSETSPEIACPACGRPFQPGNRFCQGCGHQLAGRCAACGAELPRAAHFCKRCGHRVD